MDISYEDQDPRDIDYQYAVCIDNIDLQTFLSTGKIYKCYLTKNRVLCTDDHGETNTFYKDRFKLR